MKHKFISIFIALVLALSLCLVTAVPVAAATYTVNPGESIQAAIDAAQSGDTIIVAAGTYDEDLVIDVAITLEGANVGLDPRTGGDTRLAESVIGSATIEADGVTIDGVTIGDDYTPPVDDGSEQSATIFVDGHDYCVIQNNIIYGDVMGINLYAQYDPVTGEYSDYNLVTKNLLTEYLGMQSKYGIKVKGEYNTITDNELLDWNEAAIHITSDRDEGYSPDHNVISGNTIYGRGDLHSEIGIFIKTGSYLTISDNYITGVEGEGICLQDDWTTTVVNPPTGVTVSGNTIIDLTGVAGTEHNWADSFGTLYGSIGIVSREDVTGNTFTGNTISGVHYGFVFQKYDNIVHYNNIEGGLVNEDGTGTLDATNNWWGTTVDADIALMITGNVLYDPWLQGSYPLTGDTEIGGDVPGVTGISPAVGDIDTTVSVTITGFGLLSASVVTFSDVGVTATDVVVVNDTEITATVDIAPDAAAGARDVTVTITEGDVTGFGLFTVLESLTLTAPSGIDLGFMMPGATASGQSIDVDAGSVVTNVLAWTVDAADVKAAATGYMNTATDGSGTSLAAPLQISNDGTEWVTAATGITYTTVKVLPFHVSQDVATDDPVGSYVITITFTGTY